MPQIEISPAAFDFLKTRAKPLEDTTVTVVDRLIAEFQSRPSEDSQASGASLVFNVQDAPSMKHTTIIDATVDGNPASQNYWNNILEDVIRIGVQKGGKGDDIKKLMTGNVRDGVHYDNGFRPVQEAGISFQGLEANRAFKNISALATHFRIRLAITVRWPNREDASKPNATARIVYP